MVANVHLSAKSGLLGQCAPNGVRFVSLGAHRTEGLASRVALFGINESAMRSAVIEICQMQVGGEIISPYFPLALRP